MKKPASLAVAILCLLSLNGNVLAQEADGPITPSTAPTPAASGTTTVAPGPAFAPPPPADPTTPEELDRLLFHRHLNEVTDDSIYSEIDAACVNDRDDARCRKALKRIANLTITVNWINSKKQFAGLLPPYVMTSLPKANSLGWNQINGEWVYTPQPSTLDKPYTPTPQDCDRLRGRIDAELTAAPAQKPTELDYFAIACAPLSVANALAVKTWTDKIDDVLSTRIDAEEQQEKKAEADEDANNTDTPVASTGIDTLGADAPGAGTAGADVPADSGAASGSVDDPPPTIADSGATDLDKWNGGYDQGENKIQQDKVEAAREAAEQQRKEADEARAAQEKAVAQANAKQVSSPNGSLATGPATGQASAAQCVAMMNNDPTMSAINSNVASYASTHSDSVGLLRVAMYAISAEVNFIVKNCSGSDPETVNQLAQLRDQYAQTKRTCDAISVGGCSPMKP